jgi:hypothetical protein
MMMMMRKRRDQANKRKESKKKSKNEWEKEKKRKRFNCDSFVMMRRFRNEMRSFIFENLRRMFFVFRLNTTMFSLIFISFFMRFEIWYCDVAEKTSARTMTKRERIIVDDWWKKLREQKLWSRSSERWWKQTSWRSWEKTSWKSWRESWRRSWKRSWEREFYEYKIR